MPKATKSCHKLPKVADSLSNAHKALLKIYKQAKHKVASNNNVNSVVITQCIAMQSELLSSEHK